MPSNSSFLFYSFSIIFYFLDIGLLLFLHAPVSALTMALFVPACIHESRVFSRVVPLLLGTITISHVYPESTALSVGILTILMVLAIILKSRLLMHTTITACITLGCVFSYMICVQHIPLNQPLLFVYNGIIALSCAFFYTKGKQIC